MTTLQERIALQDRFAPKLTSDVELKHARNVDNLSEKFFRALWAIDPYGHEMQAQRHGVMRQKQRYFHVLHMQHQSLQHLDQLELVRDQLYEELIAQLDDMLAKEKDRHRAEHEKQRDFLCGTARRVLRASRLGDPAALHFYIPGDDVFTTGVHPQFQVARSLWHGIREELKMGITTAVFRDRPLHPDVEFLVDLFRRVVHALENNDPRQLKFYTRSPLHLSMEQEGARLWEGTRTELHRGVNLVERRAAT